MKIIKEHFVKCAKKRGRLLQRTGGAWITKPFNNWMIAIESPEKLSNDNLEQIIEVWNKKPRIAV